jgi:hypothetical protein
LTGKLKVPTDAFEHKAIPLVKVSKIPEALKKMPPATVFGDTAR